MADESRTYEDIALEHKSAWDAGNFDRAAECLREAKALVGDKGTVKQMGDGALQLVPNG